MTGPESARSQDDAAELISGLPVPLRHCRYTVGLYSAERRTILVLHDDSVDSATLEDVIVNAGRALKDLHGAADANPERDARYRRATTRILLMPVGMTVYGSVAFLLSLLVNVGAELMAHQELLPWYTHALRAIPGTIIAISGYAATMWGASHLAASRGLRALAQYHPQPGEAFRRELGSERRVIHVVRLDGPDRGAEGATAS